MNARLQLLKERLTWRPGDLRPGEPPVKKQRRRVGGYDHRTGMSWDGWTDDPEVPVWTEINRP